MKIHTAALDDGDQTAVAALIAQRRMRLTSVRQDEHGLTTTARPIQLRPDPFGDSIVPLTMAETYRYEHYDPR